MRKHSVLVWSLVSVLLLTASVATIGAEAASAQSGRYLFLTNDLNQPVPGMEYTADDFTDLGVELFDSWPALQAAITDDVCWVGTLAVSDLEAELWLNNRNNTQELVTYDVSYVNRNLTSSLRFAGSGRSTTPWTLRHLERMLDEYSCEVIEQHIAEQARQRVELEAFWQARFGDPEGYGGIFLVEDHAEPVPGAPYTAIDFAAAGLDLVRVDEIAPNTLPEDLCVIGGLPGPFEALFEDPIWQLELLGGRHMLLLIEPEIEGYYAGSIFEFFMGVDADFKLPSLRNADGTWKSVVSIMEEIGCATEPPQPEKPSDAWEYRVLTPEELAAMAAGLAVGSPNAAIEQALNGFGAEGWELMLQLDGGLLVFKRPAQ